MNKIKEAGETIKRIIQENENKKKDKITAHKVKGRIINKFKCPECGEEMTNVSIETLTYYTIEIDSVGNVIDHDPIEELGHTQSIDCMECLADITEYITE